MVVMGMTTSQDKAPRCVIYVRNSSGHTDTNDHATKILKAYAGGRGWTIVATLADEVGAFKAGTVRPDYQELLRLIAARSMDYLLMVDQDRLSRAELVEVENLIELCARHGVRWATPGSEIDLDDPDSVAMAQVRGALARAEIKKMRKRQARKFSEITERGERVAGGQRAFGFEPMRKGETVPSLRAAEADAIRDGIRMVLGGSKVADVVREWRRRGLTSPQAGQVRKGRDGVRRPVPADFGPESGQTVRNILTARRNCGELWRNGKKIADGAWPAIVSREELDAVTAVLRQRSKTPARGAPGLLSGRTAAGRCACGNTLGHTVDVFGRAKYRCDPKTRGERPGPHVWTAPADVIDALVRDDALHWLSQPDVAGLVRAAAPEVDVAGLSAEAAALRERRLALVDMFADGELDRAQLNRGTTKVDMRLAAIDVELASAAATTPLSQFADFGRADEVWQELDHSRRREVIAALFTVTLHPHGRGKTFSEDTIEIVPRDGSEE